MKRFRSKIKNKNSVDLREEFIHKLLPGITQDRKSLYQKDWVKYLRIAIAVIRLSEYDYLSLKSGDDWQSSKAFLFGKDNLFVSVCDLLKINKNMARLKIISYKKSGMVGDPIFGPISDQYTDKDGLSLSPTSEEINRIVDNANNK